MPATFAGLHSLSCACVAPTTYCSVAEHMQAIVAPIRGLVLTYLRPLASYRVFLALLTIDVGQLYRIPDSSIVFSSAHQTVRRDDSFSLFVNGTCSPRLVFLGIEVLDSKWRCKAMVALPGCLRGGRSQWLVMSPQWCKSCLRSFFLGPASNHLETDQ